MEVQRTSSSAGARRIGQMRETAVKQTSHRRDDLSERNMPIAVNYVFSIVGDSEGVMVFICNVRN